MPKISVLMPVFNAEKYLRQAIDSILGQSFIDFELVILNDGSGDNSKEIIKSYSDSRIRFLENNENKGLSFTRNRLIDESKCEFIAWLDADDIAHKTRLEEEIKFLEAHPNHALVASWARYIDGENKPTGGNIKSYIPNEYLPALLLFVNYFVQSSVMIRKSMLPEIHYDLRFPPTEDYELWTRIASQNKVAILPKILVDYRLHATNISSTQEKRAEMTVKLNHAIQLKKLGFLPTNDELDLHYQIGFGKINSLDELKKISTWLKKIEEQNKIAKFYDSAALHYILAHRWLRVCVNNKDLGLGAVKCYFNDEFSNLSIKNLLILIHFLF